MSRSDRPQTVSITRASRLALFAFVFGILALRAGVTTAYMVRAIVTVGPNTTGEAGKVYYASRFQNGQPIFADGRSPPYYPSVHGALLHGSVGLLGRWLRTSPSELYYLGRVVSLLMSAAALALLADLGRRLGASSLALAGGLLVWIGSYDLIAHAVSYRPDNWLLFLGALGCWIVAVVPSHPASVASLVVLPTLAFHVKSPGVAVAVAIAAALALRGRWRRALGLGTAQGIVLLLSVLALDELSGGAYLAGLASTGGVPISAGNVLLALTPTPRDPVVPWLLIFPVVCLPAVVRDRGTVARTPLLPLLVFWSVTALAYGAAAARSGSNTYYFLEPASYGLLAGLIWLERGSLGNIGNRSSRLPVRMVVVPLAVAALALPTTLTTIVRGRDADGALLRSERLGTARAIMAERINEAGIYCYTDDPGLNVLLDEPAVIYPLLQTQMIDAATLPRETLLGSVQERAFDCIVLSGIRWWYRGQPALPDSFFSAVEVHYPRSEFVGPYEVRYTSSDGSRS